MMLTLDQVGFYYRHNPVLANINLAFERGGVTCLLGPNGSGKTTLLKIMLGLLPPKTGAVYFEDRPLASIPRRDLSRQIAYVPQVHREAFSYTVAEVVLMGRMPCHSSFFSAYSQKDREIADAALRRLDIFHLRHRPYTEVSGGERQLALIARSLTQGAGVFIMDEPVNGLDYGNQMRLLDGIKGLAREGLTFIMTTHFPDHALMTADRAILCQEGTIVGDGPPAKIITEDSIFRLYGIRVEMVAVNGGGRFCAPVWTF